MWSADADHHHQGGPGLRPLPPQDREGARQDQRYVLRSHILFSGSEAVGVGVSFEPDGILGVLAEKGEFVIDDIEYDEKNNKVIVKGPFDADKLSDKLCCKACKIIKEIEIVEPPPPPPPEEPKKEVPAPPPPEPEVVVPPPPAVVEEPKCPEPAPEPPKEEPPKEEPPKEEPAPPPKKEEPAPPPPKVVEIPYPWPYPYPYPAWPSDCCCHHGHGGCHCCSCKQEPAPAPAPEPPQFNIYPQYPPYPPYPQQPAYPCGGYKIVCEEDPSYACAIM